MSLEKDNSLSYQATNLEKTKEISKSIASTGILLLSLGITTELLTTKLYNNELDKINNQPSPSLEMPSQANTIVYENKSPEKVAKANQELAMNQKKNR